MGAGRLFTLVVPLPIGRTGARESGWYGARRVARGSCLAWTPLHPTGETVSFAVQQAEVAVGDR